MLMNYHAMPDYHANSDILGNLNDTSGLQNLRRMDEAFLLNLMYRLKHEH